MYGKITAYKGHIVCELLVDKSIEGEVATSLDNKDRFGQVVLNSAKNLGVSPEALILLSKVKRGRDSIGDLDWFVTNVPGQEPGHAFAWMGGVKSIKFPADCETSRQFVLGGYVPIENESAQGAMEAIDKMIVANPNLWPGLKS